MKQILNGILKLLLPLIFIGYMGVVSFYAHVHIVDGVSIVHSHPFDQDGQGFPSHSHSRAGFQLFHSLSSYSLTADVVPAFCFESPVAGNIEAALVFTGQFHLPAVSDGLSLRAPPVV